MYRLAQDLIELVEAKKIDNPGACVKAKFSPTLDLCARISRHPEGAGRQWV